MNRMNKAVPVPIYHDRTPDRAMPVPVATAAENQTASDLEGVTEEISETLELLAASSRTDLAQQVAAIKALKGRKCKKLEEGKKQQKSFQQEIIEVYILSVLYEHMLCTYDCLTIPYRTRRISLN
jgi:chorismate mutase